MPAIIAPPSVSTFGNAGVAGFPPLSVSTWSTTAGASSPRGFGAIGGGGRYAGFQFVAPRTGVVINVKINIANVVVGYNNICRLYSDSSNVPNAQIGSNSDSASFGGTGDVTTTFGTPPSISVGVTYWIIFDDASGLGDINIQSTIDVAGFLSQRGATLGAMSTLSGPEEFRIAIT